MTFVDTNVVIDILADDAEWADWSVDKLATALRTGPAFVNVVVVAEMSRNYITVEALMRAVATLDLAVSAIEPTTAFLAGQRFVRYRHARAADSAFRVLPDFFIGAHAMTMGLPLLTRDTAIYSRYFPELTLITPETNP